MARMTTIGSEEISRQLSQLTRNTEEIAKRAVYTGAKVIADEVRDNLHRVLSGTSTGALEGSLGITPIRADNNGNWNTKVGFDGYDANGTANRLKANVLESGSSRQKKRPFFRPAVKNKKDAALQAMEDVVSEELKKYS